MEILLNPLHKAFDYPDFPEPYYFFSKDSFEWAYLAELSARASRQTQEHKKFCILAAFTKHFWYRNDAGVTD